MQNTAKKAAELRALGVQVPSPPELPWQIVPASPSAEEIDADRVYQEACAVWKAEVTALYEQHVESLDSKPGDLDVS